MGGGVYCIPVGNDLDKLDSIQANENGELQHKSLHISELLAMNRLNQHQKDTLVNGMGI